MSSQRIIGNAVQTKDSNDLCLTSGAIHETCKIKPNSIPCVTDVVQLQNQTKTRPQVPTVNEIVFLNKQSKNYLLIYKKIAKEPISFRLKTK